MEKLQPGYLKGPATGNGGISTGSERGIIQLRAFNSKPSSTPSALRCSPFARYPVDQSGTRSSAAFLNFPLPNDRSATVVHEFAPTSPHFSNPKIPRKKIGLTSLARAKISISMGCKLYVMKRQRKRGFLFRSGSSFLSFTFSDNDRNPYFSKSFRLSSLLFCLDLTFPHFFTMFSHFQSLFPI
jgi:hypothetical protein